MADPTIQTFCCHRSQDSSDSIDFLSEFNSESYNKMCLASSVVGMFGAIYQILPRENIKVSHRWVTRTSSRGRHIVVWLAVADLLASFGVFVRSVLWLNSSKWSYRFDDSTITIFCGISAAWIQYFYTVTWLWTMVYAVDMRLVLREREGHPKRYHFIVWTIPAVLTATGLSILYIPNANCHNIHSVSSALLRILPNYFASYLPMAAVMIVNPLLYFTLTSDIETAVARSLGQFTNKERHIIDLIRFKFSLINLAFYVCWLPNLINGILIWTLWFDLPHEIIIGLWYIMALLNPMQALFNSLVYRRWSAGAEKIYIPCKIGSPSFHTQSEKTYANESTPLIGSSINGSSESDDENFSLK